jgi:AraC-like DNA-binding protein
MQESLPLRRFALPTVRGVDACRDALAQAYGPCSLEPRAPAASFELDTCFVPLGKRIALTVFQWTDGCETRTPELDNCFNFAKVLQGCAEMTTGTKRVEQTEKARAVVMAPRQPLRGYSPGALTHFSVRVERSAAEAQFTALTGTELQGGLEFDPDMPLTGERASIWRSVEHFANELNREMSILSSPLMMERVQETILTGLLLAQPHNGSDLLQKRAHSSGAFYVRQAEEFMESHCHDEINAARLAEVTGVSVSALYEGFRKHRGYPPMAFLKQVRLQHARNQLLAAIPGCTVTQVAARWGFLNVGRFSAEYAKQFGERPTDTLRRSQ